MAVWSARTKPEGTFDGSLSVILPIECFHRPKRPITSTNVSVFSHPSLYERSEGDVSGGVSIMHG
jgi:hypothetical protein